MMVSAAVVTAAMVVVSAAVVMASMMMSAMVVMSAMSMVMMVPMIEVSLCSEPIAAIPAWADPNENVAIPTFIIPIIIVIIPIAITGLHPDSNADTDIGLQYCFFGIARAA